MHQTLNLFLHLIKYYFLSPKYMNFFFYSFPWFHHSLSLITQPTFILFHEKFTDHNPPPFSFTDQKLHISHPPSFSFTISQIKNFTYHNPTSQITNHLHLHSLSLVHRSQPKFVLFHKILHKSQPIFTDQDHNSPANKEIKPPKQSSVCQNPSSP